jgi:hypothetical protein
MAYLVAAPTRTQENHCEHHEQAQWESGSTSQNYALKISFHHITPSLLEY